jgi:hypothetical protein
VARLNVRVGRYFDAVSAVDNARQVNRGAERHKRGKSCFEQRHSTNPLVIGELESLD